LAFQRDFFAALSKAGAAAAIAADLPPGVVATARTDGESVCLPAELQRAKPYPEPAAGYRDCLTDAAVSAR
jgi:beta-galactosidase